MHFDIFQKMWNDLRNSTQSKIFSILIRYQQVEGPLNENNKMELLYGGQSRYCSRDLVSLEGCPLLKLSFQPLELIDTKVAFLM